MSNTEKVPELGMIQELEKERLELLKRMESSLKPKVKVHIAQALSFRQKPSDYKIVASNSGTSDANLS